MNYWFDKHVLVTGATGFLGGWLVQHLLREGAKVTCIIRYPRPNSQFEITNVRDQVTVINGAVEDTAVIMSAFDGRSVFAAFHLASLVDVNAALDDPRSAMSASVDSTLNILETIRHKSPETLAIIASSDKAYGAQTLPYREDKPLEPHHPYEIAKATQDQIAQTYGKLYGLKVGVTRCGNYFGGYDFAFERIVPYTIRGLLRNEAPVLRSDGRFTRDFLYVEEAARVHLLLAEHLSKNPSLNGEAFNFSHEIQIPIIELVEEIAKMMGSNLRAVISSTVKSEIPHMLLDTKKAQRLLDWKPKTNFEQGLRKTIKWYTENLPRLEPLLKAPSVTSKIK